MINNFLNKIIQGDALDVLKTMPSESIDCVVTSPPYWNLRDYGVKGQLGLEETFQDFIDKLCEIFNEVKRVLKKQGTVWINLGDTYSGNKVGKTDNKVSEYLKENSLGIRKKAIIEEKCLCQIPSRFALQMTNCNDWILRNTIIWHKKNAMPSSVLDRFTNKYEQVFLFVKNNKYYFDLDSIRIPFETDEKRPNGLERNREHEYDSKFNALNADKKRKYNTAEGTKTRLQEEQAIKFNLRRNPGTGYDRNPKGKNPGDVWTLTSQPFPEAHFATFPEKLIVPMIKSGCPEKGIILDPFMGSGTTALVAKKLGRNYVGIELNNEYILMAERRLAQQILI